MRRVSRVRTWAVGWKPPWLRDWASDSALLLFSQVTTLLASTAIAILLARSLGPYDWGVFSAFLALSLALSVFADFGLAAWLIRELSQLAADDPLSTQDTSHQAGRLVGGGVLVTFSLGSFFVVATAITASALSLDAELWIAVVSLVAAAVIRSGSSSFEAFFRSRRQLRRVVVAVVAEKAVLLALVTLVVVAGHGIAEIALAFAVAAVVRLLINATNMSLAKEVVFRPNVPDARRVAAGSLPFALNRASLNVVPRLDPFFLALISPTAAGYFALGDRIAGPALIIPVVMSTALYPFLARESKDSTVGWRVVGALAVAGLIIAAVGIVVSPPLVPAIFGEEFQDAVPVVQVMLLVIPFVFASNPLLTHLYTTRRERRGLTVALAVVSLVGTGAIIVGQLLIGPVAAAGGYVLRQALFVASLTVAGLAPTPSTRVSIREAARFTDLPRTRSRSVR
jgi:O-antigen/teichoic acid export membrane protein